jgi:hypothetical protein
MISVKTPTYEELLASLQELELRFQALEEAHTDLLMELQGHLTGIGDTMDTGLCRWRAIS